MPRKVNSESIDQVDEILKLEDPDFVEELKTINNDELKLAELEAAFAEAEKSNTAVHRFWNEASKAKKIAVAGVLLAVCLSPVGFAIWYYYLKPPPLGQMASLERIADAVYEFDTRGPGKNLFDAFIEDEYLFEISDHVFYLKEKRDIRMARIALYLEMNSKADLTAAEKDRDEIIEVLNEVFSRHTVDDFNGIAGKEGMKRKMLASLNEKIPLKFKNIRFRLMVFN